MFSFFKKKPVVFAELLPQITFRHTYNGRHFKKKDFVHGFGLDLSLYSKILNAKGIEHTRNVYDNRIGYYIDGRKIETRIHPLHSKRLLNTENGKRYIIDTVAYQHWFGEYITLMVREEGSKSHKEVTWENISCHYEYITKNIKKNRKLYTFIDAVELHNF
jgi:hypothetical protein